jgi:hypothetical protein
MHKTGRAALSPAPSGCRGFGVFDGSASDDMFFSVRLPLAQASPRAPKGDSPEKRSREHSVWHISLPKLHSRKYASRRGTSLPSHRVDLGEKLSGLVIFAGRAAGTWVLCGDNGISSFKLLGVR